MNEIPVLSWIKMNGFCQQGVDYFTLYFILYIFAFSEI